MAKQAQLPDGTILEFPDDTPDNVMDKAVKNHINPPKSAASRFLSGVGSEVLKAASGIEGAINPDNNQSWLSKNAQQGLDSAQGTAGSIGKFIGASAPYMALPGGGIAKTALMSAGLSGATTPGDIMERLKNAALTGGMSAGIGGLAKSLSGFKPSVGAQQLMADGIQPTVGQGIDKSGLLGQTIGKLEEASKSIPFIGQAAEAARNRAKDEWAQSIVKKAEIPGLGVTAGGKIGREAIDSLKSSFSNAYDSTLNNVVIPKTRDFTRQVNDILRLNPTIAPIVKREIGTLGKGQSINANDLHRVSGTLRDIGSRYSNSPIASEHFNGEAFKDVSSTLRDYMINKLPTENANAYNALQNKYGIFKTMEKAASSVAPEGGVFNGTQLLNAVKVSDKSKDKGAFARGKARLQDEAMTAKYVLGDKLGESGTAPRMISAALLGGAGVLNPQTLAMIPIAAAGSLKPIQKALLGGYNGQSNIAELMRKIAQPSIAGIINQ